MNSDHDRPVFIDTDCHDPYLNLAREYVLTRDVLPGSPVLFLWSNEPSVVIGKNQDCYAECDVGRIMSGDVNLVRRFSGGGAVWHDRGNLCFSFCCSKQDYSVEKQTATIIEACRTLGFDAVRTGRNDIEIGGSKFSGNAYYEVGHNYCHHGTIMISCDLSRLSLYLKASGEKLKKHAVKSVRSRVVNLTDLDPSVSETAVRHALKDAFTAGYGDVTVQSPPDGEEVATLYAKLRDRDWIINKSIPGNRAFSGHFQWGGITVNLMIKDGIISDCYIISDMLDSQIPDRFSSLLKGRPYSNMAIREAAAEAGGQWFAEDISSIMEQAHE